MSDIDVVSRKDVLNMAYLSVFVDNDGHEVDEPRYVIDASDVERLSAAELPMGAVEFVRQFHRMCQSINCDECGLLHDDKVPRSCVCLLGVYPEFAVETIEKWAREHPERSEE